MKNLFVFAIFSLILTGIHSQELTKEKFVYDSKGKRDPFFKEEVVKESGSIEPVEKNLSPMEKLNNKGISVSSIVWDPRNPAILINDDILEVGDSIKGVVIRAIEKEFVVFEIDGELVEVPMT